MRDHPVIERTIKTGFPYSERRSMPRTDGLGVEAYPGEEILVLNDEFYVVKELFQETIEVLEQQGAIYEIAK